MFLIFVVVFHIWTLVLRKSREFADAPWFLSLKNEYSLRERSSRKHGFIYKRKQMSPSESAQEGLLLLITKNFIKSDVEIVRFFVVIEIKAN